MAAAARQSPPSEPYGRHPRAHGIALSLLPGGGVSVITVIARFMSNILEGLSSAAGMKKAARSATCVFEVDGDRSGVGCGRRGALLNLCRLSRKGSLR